MRAPDYIEPIVAWRVWYAADSADGLCLSSVVHRALWPHGEPLVATCHRFRLPMWPFRRAPHDAPSTECRCGIYGATAQTMRLYLPESIAWIDVVPVLGRVSLWGVVHEHEDGWRASLAYPETLFVPVAQLGARRAARAIHDLGRYGVPVLPVGSGTVDSLVAEVSAA
jgi:hypothetical protein